MSCSKKRSAGTHYPCHNDANGCIGSENPPHLAVGPLPFREPMFSLADTDHSLTNFVLLYRYIPLLLRGILRCCFAGPSPLKGSEWWF